MDRSLDVDSATPWCESPHSVNSGSSNSRCSSFGSSTPSFTGSLRLGIFAQVLLLSSDKSKLLMTYENEQWRLPYFNYKNPNSLRRGRRIYRFCHDMLHFFDVDPDCVQFTAAVELMGEEWYTGERYDMYVNGWQWVLVTECQPDGRPEELPLSAKNQLAWKDLAFFTALVEQLDEVEEFKIMQTVLQYVKSNSTLRLSISDPRLQIGWFKKAAHLLIDVASGDGAEEVGQVIQQQMTPLSTILKVNSSLGWYFAKSPAWGSNECSVTAEIARFFPEDSPTVLSTNAALNCFITKGFDHNPPGTDELGKLGRKLGEMQLKSLSHIDELQKAGCPMRDPVRLMEKLKSWETNLPFEEGIVRPRERFLELISIALEACRKLVEEYNIPSTLVHGDFAQTNSTYSGPECESVWLFDWQFACISHPFSEFYRMIVYENIPEEVLDEMVDEYLRLWEQFEELKRAREAYENARMLGFFLKLWALEEARASCDYQNCSKWQYMIMYTVDQAYETIVNSNLLSR